MSDLHLGWQFSKASIALSLLETSHPEFLYLVGDTFEWLHTCKPRSSAAANDTKTAQRPSGPAELLREFETTIERLQAAGTRVFVIPGNHDLALADETARNGVIVRPYVIHQAIDGRRFLIIHGDVFDLRSNSTPDFWRRLGGNMYPRVIRLGDAIHRFANRMRFHSWAHTPNFHWGTRIKLASARVRRHIADFESFMSRLAEEHQCEGVICGHIHFPAKKHLEQIQYINCGDWIEHCSYVFESFSGDFELVTHQP